MPPLISKWEALKDDDKDLFPLLEVRINGGILILGAAQCCGRLLGSPQSFLEADSLTFTPINSIKS